MPTEMTDPLAMVNRAIGVLMGREALDQLTAFDRLRVAARDAGRTLVEHAVGIVNDHDVAVLNADASE